MKARTCNHLFLRRCGTVMFIGLILALSACNKKKRSGGGGGALPPTPVPTPVVVDPPSTSTVGEPVPPITDDDVTVIETENAPAIKHLIFEASDAMEESRYLSEYLMIVRAADSSCIKLKVRPTDGVANDTAEEISDKKDDADKADSGAGCDFAKEVDKKDEKEDGAPPEEEGTAALTSGRVHAADSLVQQLHAIDFSGRSASMRLANTYSLCSLRLFRMPIAPAEFPHITVDLGKVASKTGRLVAISSGKKVRVWLDDEVGNACAGGSTPHDLPKVDFGPINKIPGLVATLTGGANTRMIDQLKLSQLASIANETETAMGRLTDVYGKISDIDGSKTVDVFISPDVNRNFFIRSSASISLDRFRSNYINKPQDLGLFDAIKNPTSNEGEIVYLWAPDPAGLYIYNKAVSSNALTGNYAKGFIGSQLMNLIIHGQRLVAKDPIKPEEPWLVQSLGYLASGYVGGIDYSRYSLGQYMTSRPQYLSLTDGPDTGIGIGGDVHMGDESDGLRAMFGWYLHAKLCSSTSVAPCDKIKGLVTSDLSGTANVAKGLGLEFDVALTNFGASTGVSLAEEPAKALAFWSSGKKGLPEKPVLLPELSEIYPDDVNKTQENPFNAGTLIAGKADRTLAGAFPSKNMLLFQPILPDNEMDLQLAKNSVTYILLTGLIEPDTDMTVVLGKKLNVVIVPLGERDGDLRRIHTEKTSEYAHADLRSTNLTDLAADAARTYNKDPEYGTDYTVTAGRELWILGSIDNFTVPAPQGAAKEVADTDAFNIKVEPCTDSPDSGCASESQYLMVQLIPRDFTSELFPMFFATTTNLNVFAGANKWARINDLDLGYQAPTAFEDLTEKVDVMLCQSAESTGGTAGDFSCANDGVTAAQYATAYCGGDCSTTSFRNDLSSAAFFGAHNSINNGFLFGYDNFFYSGPFGYPYTTVGTLFYRDSPERHRGEYYDVEANRQFFSYKYNLDARPFAYYIYSVDAEADMDPDVTMLSTDQINNLVYLKTNLAAQGNPASDAFIEVCSELGFGETECENPGAGLEESVIRWIYLRSTDDLPKRIVCYDVCPGSADTVLTDAGTTQYAWFNLSAAPTFCSSCVNDKLNLVIAHSDLDATNGSGFFSGNWYRSFYQANEPIDKDGTCTGGRDLNGNPASYSEACSIREDSLPEIDDIRRQFNSSTARITQSAYGQYYPDYNFMGDYYSYESYRHKSPGHMAFDFWDYPDAVDRNRNFTMAIEGRRGEVVGKPFKLHPLIMRVPPGAATVVHIMIGGKEQSKGKYLLRVRTMPAD